MTTEGILSGIFGSGGRPARLRHLSLFCRHNRYTADCPICSKGTVLEPGRRAQRRSRPAGKRPVKRSTAAAPTTYAGPYAAAGPYEDAGGEYEARLERVPGGLRLATWAAGSIRRAAPVLAAADLSALVLSAAERGVIGEPLPGALGGGVAAAEPGAFGASPGNSGELRDELRVEALEQGRVRIARWILRPNAGWELQEAPVMLPPARFAEALERAAARGVLASEPAPGPRP